ncbi:hypothetical protein M2306_000851 [Myroides gitamensis]|uniref:DUF3570 domain-containing protein n=1 Tax=Myroides odoratus TaxID=256 RepID=UPI0021696373|nr:DUF3570 domain-containing protein [Myroides odoratus]MCS4238080.1 hypothetical protein [Myroides odoratus]MDH6600157.1 hypothetical protein [Myroides gitamensis]
MKKRLITLMSLTCVSGLLSAQEHNSTPPSYKKKVLETTELDFLGSYYDQKGKHSAVNGGMGTEELDNYAGNMILSIPVRLDGVLSFDVGFSAYTSASSSNINPFMSRQITQVNATGASTGATSVESTKTLQYGSPWYASTGPSRKDVLYNLGANYSHSSDDRNTILTVNAAVAREFDYESIGVGIGVTKLFNEKNTEVGLKANAYFDTWKPFYPTELDEYHTYGTNFQNAGYFANVEIYDQNGNVSTKYLPDRFVAFDDYKRNSYAVSLFATQIVTEKMQLAVFADVLYQKGLLSTPYHRIYFADKPAYYIGTPNYIPLYDSPQNTEVYRLADDIERLPDTRFKLPIGMRLNYYVNNWLTLRSYYRFYTDDWELRSHTFSLELPVKISERITLFLMYRFYTQSETKYFAPFGQHTTKQKYYTSDYDLSAFDSHQYGGGLVYNNPFSKAAIGGFSLKNFEIRYNYYDRNDGLSANIVSVGLKFVQ